MITRVALALLATLTGGAAMLGGARAATPPPQPKAGPGSPLDTTTDVVKRGIGRVGQATYAYHLAAEPAAPRSVVVVLHAWGAVNPIIYGGWIQHLARRGHLVLFPAFQTVGRTRPADATEAAAKLVKAALAELAADGQAKPDPGRIAYLGHSAGAGVAVKSAAAAETHGLAKPRLVFLIMPGGVASDEKARGIQLANLGKVDPATSIVAMVGDREFQAAERVSRRILRETVNVPPARKLFMRAFSDDHGFPALTATLASAAGVKEGYEGSAVKLEPEPPVNPKGPRPVQPKWMPDMNLTGEQTVLLGQLQRGVVDALDYLAYWRTFDMAFAAALAGGEMATLRTETAFIDMGRWSDGWPVRRLAAETPKPGEPAGAAAAPATGRQAGPPPIQSKQPVTRRRETRRDR